MSNLMENIDVCAQVRVKTEGTNIRGPTGAAAFSRAHRGCKPRKVSKSMPFLSTPPFIKGFFVVEVQVYFLFLSSSKQVSKAEYLHILHSKKESCNISK